ncbi:hypothetical protein CBM2634_B170253 [Cupriavidus taiwanensis]|uniref:Uncharacterized protein n=1 Tax=Cupriavidus taiwanensis TaxID=164546 RepID=A0A375JBG9_9BURK|nr:hypothetical protein CBM2634_B170253 [Cupriavidus taiwanensis]
MGRNDAPPYRTVWGLSIRDPERADVPWPRRAQACVVAFFCNTLAAAGGVAGPGKRLLRPLNRRMRHIACRALSLFATPGFASGISGVNRPGFCFSGRCTGWIESCVAQLRTILLFPPQCLIPVLFPTLV